MDVRWRFLVAVGVSVCALAGTAHASPLFTTGGNISAEGQDAYEPQVTVDPSGNAHAVWTRSVGAVLRTQYSTRTPTGNWSTPVSLSDAGQAAINPQIDSDSSGNLLVVWARSDGANLRIQATFKPAGGSFTTAVNISDPGFDAFEPQVDFDDSGKAIAVWSRADGSSLTCCGRVQASVRGAGVAGTFENEVTLSDPGQDAFDVQIAAGPDADVNSALVWVRSDGTNLRVQSARRKDYVGYPRPLSAGFVRVSLTPAYDECQSANANRTHGAPLAHPSCNPPSKTSSALTVGTNDANGFGAGSVSSLRWSAIVGDVATEANEADVQATIKITDVRQNVAPGYADYAGVLGIRVPVQITDQRNSGEQPEAGTSETTPLDFPVQCVATTSTTIGGACNATTSLNALLPGAAIEKKRSIWALGQTLVRDAGANGTGYAQCPPVCGDGDEKVFMRQGVFVP